MKLMMDDWVIILLYIFILLERQVIWISLHFDLTTTQFHDLIPFQNWNQPFEDLYLQIRPLTAQQEVNHSSLALLESTRNLFEVWVFKIKTQVLLSLVILFCFGLHSSLYEYRLNLFLVPVILDVHFWHRGLTPQKYILSHF